MGLNMGMHIIVIILLSLLAARHVVDTGYSELNQQVIPSIQIMRNQWVDPYIVSHPRRKALYQTLPGFLDYSK